MDRFGDTEKADLTKASARNGKVLTDPTFAFQLVVYPDGSPAPILLQKEVEMSTAVLADQP